MNSKQQEDDLKSKEIHFINQHIVVLKSDWQEWHALATPSVQLINFTFI